MLINREFVNLEILLVGLSFIQASNSYVIISI